MRPRVPDGYAVEYEYGVTMSKRPPKGMRTCVETMYVDALLTPPADHPTRQHGTGRAILNPRDTFSLHIGRDVALGRALKCLEADLALTAEEAD